MTRSMAFKTNAPDVDGIKDLWRTPPHIFAPVHARFAFTLDAAAAAETALVPAFISAEQDALVTPWGTPGDRSWCNPPYSRTGDFTARALAQSLRGITTAALVPSTVDVRWWHRDVFGEAAECWFYTGRIGFIHPVTGEVVRGNKGGSQLVVWTPKGPGLAGTRFGTLSHKTGEPVGQADRAYWYANSFGRKAA